MTEKKLKINLLVTAILVYYWALLFPQVNMECADAIKKLLVILSIGLVSIYCIKVKVLMLQLSLKGVFWLLIFGMIFLVSLYTRDFYLLALLVFVFASKRADSGRIFHDVYVSLGLFTVMIVFLSLIGILHNIVDVRYTAFDYVWGGQRNRYSFGFKWPLVLPDILVFWTLYYQIVRKKLSMVCFVILQIFGLLAFYFCNSRLGFVALEMTFFLCFVCNYLNKHDNHVSSIVKKIIIFMAKIIFPSIALLSIVLLSLYQEGQGIAYLLNGVLSNRLQWAAMNFNLYPAQIINMTNFDAFAENVVYTLDNGYYYAILRYGYCFIVLVSAVCYKLTGFFERENNLYGMIAVIVLSIMNFIDNNLTSHGFFPILIVGLIAVKQDLRRKHYKKSANIRDFYT